MLISDTIETNTITDLSLVTNQITISLASSIQKSKIEKLN